MYQLRVHDKGPLGYMRPIGPVLPTPMLLSVGHNPTEAYEDSPASDKYPAVWRARDDKYDPPDTTYTLVTVERVEE